MPDLFFSKMTANNGRPLSRTGLVRSRLREQLLKMCFLLGAYRAACTLCFGTSFETAEVALQQRPSTTPLEQYNGLATHELKQN